MHANALLTQDELDFIQNMQHSPQLNLADPISSLLVNGDRRIQALLTHLMANETVQLQARFNNQQISFPLQLVEDEFHALHLQLGSPEIYESSPKPRPWRMTLEQPAALLDEQDKHSGLWVREISSKGVLVHIRELPSAPRHFDLRFAPDDVPAIRLHGTLRRRIGPDLAAYDLGGSAQEEIERLREYILQAHRQAHPELHVQVSN